MNKVLISSESLIWETDPELIKDLSTVFDWDLDVCASRSNVCPMYFDEHDDGLSQDWSLYHARWMNPPYGKEVKKWVQKAVEERHSGYTISLLFNRAGTNWFQDLVAPYASMIVTIRGRLKFGTKEAWVQRWVEKYYVQAARPWELAECVGSKALIDVNFEAWEWLFDTFEGTHPDTDFHRKWLQSNKVRRDSAPADSIFAVFGSVANNMSMEQITKLKSYGLVTTYGR